MNKIYMMQKQTGFTIIELMISITLLALLLTFGVPSFVSVIERNKLASQNNLLVGALHLTRSESVKRGKTVTLCKSTDGINCSTNAGVGYEAGWIVFEEQSETVNPVGTRDVANESIIKVQGALDDQISLRGSGNVNYKNFIAYVPSGAISAATAESSTGMESGYMVMCLDNDITKARAVFVTILGRPYSGKDTDKNGAPENENNVNLTTCTP